MWCESCWAVGCFTRPMRRRTGEALARAARPLSAADLCRERWSLTTCEVTGLSWAPGAVWFLYGPPGSRKTTLAALIAGQASPVCFVSGEMNAGPALASLLHYAGLSRRRDCTIYRQADAETLATEANCGAAIILDSVQMLTLQPGDTRALADAGSRMVIAISQVRKDGLFKGDSGWLHEADIALHLDGGRWECVKSRFGPIGTTGRVGSAPPPPPSKELCDVGI